MAKAFRCDRCKQARDGDVHAKLTLEVDNVVLPPTMSKVELCWHCAQSWRAVFEQWFNHG